MIAGGISRLTKSSACSSRTQAESETKDMPGEPEHDGDESGEEKKLDMVETMVEKAKKKTPSADGGLADDVVKNGRQKSPTKVANGGQQHVGRLPDMTGKIITVSAEETLKLTNDSKKNRRKGGKKDPCRSQEIEAPGSEKETTIEKEFQDLIANMSSANEGCHERAGGEDEYKPAEGGNSTPRHQNLPAGTFSREEADADEFALRNSAYISEYTLNTTMNNIVDPGRRISEYTVDYTIDTWSKTDEGTRRKSETTLVDPDTTLIDPDTSLTAISESAHDSNDFDCTIVYGKNSDTNDTVGTNSRLNASSHRAFQSLRSSFRRRLSIDENEKQANSRPEGISWASLIDMDTERKGKTTSSARRRTPDKCLTDVSLSSFATPDSKVSSRSKMSKNSYQTKSSYGSKKSNGSGNTVSWKDESVMTKTLSTDPEYIRKQAKERFQRGVHYAERGKFAMARERFLVALRYRVMHRGPNHPYVAAVHEMLGHINYFLSLEAEEDDFEASLVKFDERERGHDSMLGWDVTILENDKSKRRGKVYHEKAAMHYRTVLDILGVSQSLDGTKESDGYGAASSSAGVFRWSDIAETYAGLDGDSDDDSLLGAAILKEIASRVLTKLDLLPVAATSFRSYATTFLDS